MELHSCLAQVWTLKGLHSPMTAPCFLQSYRALLPRPHLLKLVDLADEEVPVAPSDLCVCNMDHVLGREQDESRKRIVLLAGRQQELPNIRINLKCFTPAMVQHHTYLTCASHTAPIQLSLGCLPLIYLPGMGLWCTHFPHSHTLCFCLPCSTLTVPIPVHASLFSVMLYAMRAGLRHGMRPCRKRSAIRTKNTGQPGLLPSKKPNGYCFD